MVLFRMLNCQRVALWLRQTQESPPGAKPGGLCAKVWCLYRCGCLP